MPSGCYRVEVLSYLNPHLIWVEVCDQFLPKNEYLFEQIGVYGVLPLEKTLNVITEGLNSKKCNDWLPATSVVMKDFFEKKDEIWFSPTHIDRRTSIFDDNVHKYGELLIKSETGKLKKLSKHLLQSGFAYKDVCEFHEKLSCGKLNTKLNPDETQTVIMKLENYYKRMKYPKNNWKKSVEKQTSVFQMTQSFESELSVSNLVLNDRVLNKTLKNKYKDFELCKDVDEESLGRGYHKDKSVNPEANKETLKSQYLIKKLSMMSNSKKSGDLNQTYSDIVNFLNTSSRVKENLNQTNEALSTTSDNNTSSEMDVVTKENILSRKLKQFNEVEKFKRRISSGSESGKTNEDIQNVQNVRSAEESKLGQEKHNVKNIDKGCNQFGQKLNSGYEIQVTKNLTDHCGEITRGDGFQEKKDNNSKRAATNVSSGSVTRIAFGPPGLRPTSFNIQLMTVPDFVEEEELTLDAEKEAPEKCDRMYDEVDSEVGIEITNKNTLKDYLQKVNNVNFSNDSDKIVQNDGKSVKSSNRYNLVYNKKPIQKENILHNKSGDINSDDSVDKYTSSLIKRKLKVYYNTVKQNCNFSGSDTSNKDSSSGDESIEKVIDRLTLKYKDDSISKKDGIPANEEVSIIKLKNHVNPFKNIDPNISVFVDKLVSPVLMVHSKGDNRIQPVFELRDVYFNGHIHNVIRNLSIDQPMTVQSITWSVILRGLSLFIISPMGSGKTLGYLPAVCSLISDSIQLNCERCGPVCIIVCATAQSVTYVEKKAKMFLESKKRVLACYAGVDNFHITTTLLNGCDLLISTPSCLVRLMQATDFGVELGRLSTFVLDDCERLSEVYADDIKYFTYQIKEMLKLRADKHLKVQYIVASRIWCDFFTPLAKKIPDTVVVIGAFQECVLYSKSNTSVTLIKKENKIDSVFEFLKDINASKRTVIVCRSNDEVALLEKALKRSKHVVFSCDNDMTIHDLYNMSVSWADFEEPLIGPILICCDSNLMHMNITDAHNLIHYSMPPLFSMFCKRFSVLNDNYPSIFKANNENIQIKILLEENNVEQLPKLLNFIKRCTDNVPDILDEISSNILAEKDKIKAIKYYPICDSLLTLGYCPDIYNCQERHTIFKEYDSPKDWMPKGGTITCKILYYQSATLYSARLLSCTVNGTTTNYPQTYSKLSMKMGTYYSKESNKKLHGIPKIGDVCAISIKLNFFLRCQVLKILSKYERGNPNKVLVKLIDEERMEVTRDIYLYHLPEELKQIASQVVLVRLANIEPKDKDITFSDLARDRLKNITNTDTELFVRGNVALTIGNCIFVNTLEACQELTSLNEVVVKYDLKQELLRNHAIPNPAHLIKLEKLCIQSGLTVKQESKMIEPKDPVKNLSNGTWAHLEVDCMSSVFFASAINPDKFFVRLDKFESCMSGLLKDIKKYVDANPTQCGSVKEGEIVLAKFPDDETYERARIDHIKEDSVKCFFVDQGDWREIPLNHLIPITEQLVNQLPFQAIECRLVGIKPLGDQWTDFSTYWFIDNCYNDSGNLKYLFVKYYSKEPAEFTNGHKYGVAVIDTNIEHDVILNQLMIDLNLAQEKHSEIEYLENLKTKEPERNPTVDMKNKDYEEAVTRGHQEQVNVSMDEQSVVPSQSNTFLKTPLRSVPLVNSDNESDDSDKWDVNVGDNYMDLFPVLKDLKKLRDNVPQVNTVKPEDAFNKPKNVIQKTEAIELDSDDLTSPDGTLLAKVSPKDTTLINDEKVEKNKPFLEKKIDADHKISPVLESANSANKKMKSSLNFTEEDQKRRPKLVWRQNKTSVTVKIQLIGADDYKLNMSDRVLDFSANLHDTDFAFKLELYGVVDKEKCSHVNKGQYILVKLKKVLTKNWLTLTRDGGIKKWIVYDVDNLDASSEEETVDDTIKDIVRNIHESVDTESEDDDVYDDIMN
ncbi:jg17100 [Pararge aegeria aegeria]|uniref:RNA helicase n=1 Tax=Pararge aegeria aegeria TaxID=348720 RepID=A0A8S4R0Q1_9NEOP|nr:jg17100 [Pararge aegeria aegeria]